MTDIDYWVLGETVTNFNVIFVVAIMFSIYIYEIKKLIKYIKEQKQLWRDQYL